MKFMNHWNSSTIQLEERFVYFSKTLYQELILKPKIISILTGPSYKRGEGHNNDFSKNPMQDSKEYLGALQTCMYEIFCFSVYSHK